MKHLDFPVSAAAVRLHGREFHEQDFYTSANLPISPDTGLLSGAVPAQRAWRVEDVHPHLDGQPNRPGVVQRLWILARWTFMCIGFALAAAVMVAWLARTDLQNAHWVDSVAAQSKQPSQFPRVAFVVCQTAQRPGALLRADAVV